MPLCMPERSVSNQFVPGWLHQRLMILEAVRCCMVLGWPGGHHKALDWAPFGQLPARQTFAEQAPASTCVPQGVSSATSPFPATHPWLQHLRAHDPAPTLQVSRLAAPFPGWWTSAAATGWYCPQRQRGLAAWSRWRPVWSTARHCTACRSTRCCSAQLPGPARRLRCRTTRWVTAVPQLRRHGAAGRLGNTCLWHK